METEFRSWLLEQLRLRNMSRSHLARQINASPSLISRYINEDVRPGPKYAERIARVFRVDVDFVRAMVGLDPRDHPVERLRNGEVIGMVKRVNLQDTSRYTTITGILRTWLDEDARAAHESVSGGGERMIGLTALDR